MEFLVITWTPQTGGLDREGFGESEGNLALALSLFLEVASTGGVVPVASILGRIALVLRQPVFQLGEVLVVQPGETRELVGAQRDPSRWDVRYERRDSIEEAVLLAQRALEATSTPEAQPTEEAEGFRQALQALGFMYAIADRHDFGNAAREVARMDSVGPILHPMEYRDSLPQLRRNGELFAAGAAFHKAAGEALGLTPPVN